MPGSRQPEDRLPALVRAEAQRVLAESEVEADPARLAAGWERRFIIEGGRAAEMVGLYRELGYEAVADPLRLASHRSRGDDDCADCRLVMALDFRMLYTRRMDPRVHHLIERLRLEPHPEGGWYREVHRSGSRVQPADGRADRAAMTVIHFLLAGEETSHWHRIASDEAWHWQEGDPLELWTWDDAKGELRIDSLGPMATGASPLRLVRAGTWQAARTQGAYTLVSCSVGPGFEFEDFTLLRDRPEAERLRRDHPEAAGLL